MRQLLVLSAVLAAAALAVRPGPAWHELSSAYTFDKFAADYGRAATTPKDSAEWRHRKALYEAKLADVLAHNADPTQTWKKGINHFSDWTEAEFKDYNKFRPYKRAEAHAAAFPRPASTAAGGLFGGLTGSARVASAPSLPLNNFTGTGLKLPASVDYRNSLPSVLSGVKNQGHCGSCWAHSCVETVESFFAIKYGELPVLSPQQVASCTDSMFGCGGGDYVAGWQYVAASGGAHEYGGLYEEFEYPYTDFFCKNMTKAGTATCQNVTSQYLKSFPWYPKANVSAIYLVTPNDAHVAMDALAHAGPLSVSVAAYKWNDYEAGIFQNNASWGNNSFDIDHAVQMIGYGHDAGLKQDYFVIRNSWGTTWGESGTIRLLRPAVEPCAVIPDEGKVCGTSAVLSYPAFPEVSMVAKKNV